MKSKTDAKRYYPVGKILCFWALAMFLLWATSICASALEYGFSCTNNSQRIIQFDAHQYANLSDYDTGAAKMLESGHSADMIRSIPQNTIESIAGTQQAIQTTKYYTEVGTGTSVRFEETTVPRLKTELTPAIVDPDSITVVGLNGSVLHLPGVPKKFEGASVEVKTTLYPVDSVLLSHYLVVSEFIWTRMPSYRGTDLLGITRDTNTAVIPNGFGGYTAYETQSFLYHAAPYGVTAMEQSFASDGSTTYYEKFTQNNVAVAITMPKDIKPPFMMYANCSFRAYYHYALRGGVYYEYALSQPTIVPTSFSHWITYGHQKSTAWFTVPYIFAPVGEPISIQPAASYSKPIISTTTYIWKYQS